VDREPAKMGVGVGCPGKPVRDKPTNAPGFGDRWAYSAPSQVCKFNRKRRLTTCDDLVGRVTACDDVDRVLQETPMGERRQEVPEVKVLNSGLSNWSEQQSLVHEVCAYYDHRFPIGGASPCCDRHASQSAPCGRSHG